MRFFVFVFAAIAFFASCNSSSKSSSEVQVLKFNLEKGKAYSYSMEINMENEMGDRKIDNEMNFEYDMEVTDDKDGIKTLKTSYKRVVMGFDAGGTKVDIDTDKPATDTINDPQANPMNMMGKMFHAIVGKNFIMKVDAEGNVTEVSGLKEMGDDVISSMNLKEELKPMIRRLFVSQFNEENLKQSFSQGFNIFPNKAVKVGDTWDKTIVMKGMITTTMNSTYKVKSITADKITLDVNGKIEAGNTAGTYSGTMAVDTKTGLVTEGDMVQKFEGKMTNRMKIIGKEK